MSDKQTPEKASASKSVRITRGLLGLGIFLVAGMLVSGDGELQGWATGSESVDFSQQPVSDISWSEKSCCCKAGCPDGSYFCRAMCHILGGTCTRSARSFNGGNPAIRNSCMGATYGWWSGVTCPSSCPANSSVSP